MRRVRNLHSLRVGRARRYTDRAMSKIREQFERPPEAPLAVEPTGDLRPYVVFTQLKPGGPYIYAGWLEAADDTMAMDFAKEHYGQDQECVNIQVIRREHITSSDGLYAAMEDEPSPQPSPSGRGSKTTDALRSFVVYTQKRAGDLWISAPAPGIVDSAKPQAALEVARTTIKQAAAAHVIWVVPVDKIISTHGDLIWRHTDQSYRLARGYGREVRAKWVAFRDEQKLAEYEKDDLQEAF